MTVGLDPFSYFIVFGIISVVCLGIYSLKREKAGPAAIAVILLCVVYTTVIVMESYHKKIETKYHFLRYHNAACVYKEHLRQKYSAVGVVLTVNDDQVILCEDYDVSFESPPVVIHVDEFITEKMMRDDPTYNLFQ